ncbi:unnamed protein product, partial [Mesorhabditis belari]|uniref:Xylose isomerase-like TIM barrel domain-containing protein n=1 Tax=Mesorhabditis belari TaxID=2138241 RepID=A0AAF3J4T7_9BILA
MTSKILKNAKQEAKSGKRKNSEDGEVKPKTKKRVYAGESKQQEASRTTVGEEVLAAAEGSQKYLGVHVSGAGSLEQAIYNARAIGCRAFAFFVRNGRTWNINPLEKEVITRWHDTINETGFDLTKILPHGSYLINPGSLKDETLEKSRAAMLEECKRAETLGIGLYNFHPGSTTGLGTPEESCKVVAETINYIHSNTSQICLVIETMAGQGDTIGRSFAEIADMIKDVDDKDRVGVCIDTCHVFAAGYEFNTSTGYDKMMDEFEEKIGFKYLKGFHINDSKDVKGCCKDRHELIGKGHIGVDGFRRMMNDDRLNNIPLILETPEIGDNYPKEMILLHGLEDTVKSSTSEDKVKTKKPAKVLKASNKIKSAEEVVEKEEEADGDSPTSTSENHKDVKPKKKARSAAKKKRV